MIKFILTVVLAFASLLSFAQSDTKTNDASVPQTLNPVPFRLFPTRNIYTFIKLDTRNGRMWQVQFSTKEDGSRFTTSLSLEPLVSVEKEVKDRFTLQATTNIYTFILLDQIDGRTWQVQWSGERKERLVLPIE